MHPRAYPFLFVLIFWLLSTGFVPIAALAQASTTTYFNQYGQPTGPSFNPFPPAQVQSALEGL